MPSVSRLAGSSVLCFFLAATAIDRQGVENDHRAGGEKAPRGPFGWLDVAAAHHWCRRSAKQRGGCTGLVANLLFGQLKPLDRQALGADDAHVDADGQKERTPHRSASPLA